ncbi:MAG: 50S ribosomal protein L14e [Candidatus Diapherotrites archaeon]|uniref:50S ribosomal protein L14e n=1 Tax=Candidatus Iainarchaeum sp. TaxID=3101447 RepID=A0A8T4L445_9ARCH|nr:50S ribosomal protein L14e [Candidatus Diapherotrites archaeon]
MAGIEVGRICIKTTGRNAGKRVVVVDIEKDGFVTIEGVEVKRKRCNPSHLFVTPEKAELKKGAKREEIVSALK